MERRRGQQRRVAIIYWLTEAGAILLLLASVVLFHALDAVLSGQAASVYEVVWPPCRWLDHWPIMIMLGVVVAYALLMSLRLYQVEGLAQRRAVRLGQALGHLTLARQNSERDPLTGALTRVLLEERMKHEGIYSHRKHQPLSVIMMDIDHFKHINDTYGHAAGDEILKQFAATAMGFLRSTDQFYRYGGEEFLLLMPDTRASTAAMVAERFRAALTRASFTPVNITASFGVAQLRPDEMPHHTLARADEALYRAKGGGRNRVVRGD